MKFIKLKISNHAFKYLLVLIVLLLISTIFSLILSFLIFFILCFVAYFFRDPDRFIPNGDNLIVSPADGTIICVDEVPLPKEISNSEIKFKRVGIFLSVFDVHINRVPFSGIVKSIKYVSGKFVKANIQDSDIKNERNIILIETKQNDQIVFVQIAGLIARRIVCNIKENDEIIKGDKFGMIKFGSRTDIYFPSHLKPQVFVGQKVVGGESVIADFKNSPSFGAIEKK